jgi:hypothetical protein
MNEGHPGEFAFQSLHGAFVVRKQAGHIRRIAQFTSAESESFRQLDP